MSINKALVKDNLYEAVNGDWIKEAVIPDDKSSTGGFTTLRDDVEKLLMDDTSRMAKGEIEIVNPEQEEFIKYYRLAHDFEERDTLAEKPILPYVEKIKELKSYQDLQTLAPQWVLNSFALPFTLGISADMKNTDLNALYISVPSTILPDTTYYQEGNQAGEQLLEVYRQMAQNVLEMMHVEKEEARKLVDDMIKFDRLLIPHLKSSEELADYTKNYNPRTAEEVEAYLDHFSFNQLFTELIGEQIDKAIVTQPAYYEALKDILTDEHFDLLKSWMIVRLMVGSTSVLSEELRQAGSAFSLALSGNPKTQSQEKHAYYLSIGQYDHVIGDYYAKQYFGPKARSDVREMVEAMIEVYKKRLKENDWLSEETIKEAIVKLDAIDIMVGYPDEYPVIYRQLIVDESKSFYDNLKAFVAIRNKDELAKWNKPVDHTEWHMSADTVNAYYSPSSNLICFPAAILQAPFYCIDQSRSANYGGIGAVIGHEISHAFDNNGAKFDEKGNMNNWWTDEDFKVFDEKAKAMIRQFDGIPFAGGQVNGTLTVSENIADAGGLTAAIEALKQESQYNLEEFFYNWARVWCQKARQEYKELLLAIDVHAPAELRGNIQPRNLNEFYTTFDVKEGDGMYFKPEDRVQIW